MVVCGTLIKAWWLNNAMRPLCKVCGKAAAAINGYHNNKIYYRSRCNQCIRKDRKQKPGVPRWQLSGYRKKSSCDRCGFQARHASQLMVYHVNGDLADSELRNLKTVCLNCAVLITRLDLPWRRGDLEPDL
jgi:hypothetical protein